MDVTSFAEQPSLDKRAIAALRQIDPENPEAFVTFTIERFAKRSPEVLTDLRAAFNIQDGGKIFELAHRYSSMCGIVGAARMCQIAKRIEKAGHESLWSELSLLIDELDDEFLRVKGLLSTDVT